MNISGTVLYSLVFHVGGYGSFAVPAPSQLTLTLVFTGVVNHHPPLVPLPDSGLQLVFDGELTLINRRSTIRQAMADLARLFRFGCLGNLCESQQIELLTILNAGYQEFIASSRAQEFVTFSRVQEYPAEFTDIVAAGGIVSFKAANGLLIPAGQPDFVRSSTHKYKCIQDHDYDTSSPEYSSPASAGAVPYWVQINEMDYDLFLKGLPLPRLSRSQAGFPLGRTVQHIVRVWYALQVTNKQTTYSLAPIAAGPLNSLKTVDLNVNAGNYNEWFEGATVVGSAVSGVYSGAAGSTLLTFTLTAASTVRLASTVNINLVTLPVSIDGVALNNGDAFLAKNQSAPAENGVYIVTGASGVRSTAFSTWASFYGASLKVTEGTANAGTAWISGAAASGTLGVTTLPFTAISASTTPPTVTRGRWVFSSSSQIPPGTRVFKQRRNGDIELDTAITSAVIGDTITFRPDAPPLYYECFRNVQNHIFIRCFPSANGDVNSSVFVQYIPTARQITWADVVNSADFEVAPEYVELYLMPVIRHAALHSSFMLTDELEVRGKVINERYAQVTAFLSGADIQQPSVIK